MKTLKQLLEERASKQAEADKIIKLAETESRELTKDEEERADQLLDDVEALGPMIAEKQEGEKRANERKERLAKVTSATPVIPRGPEPADEDRNDPVLFPERRKYSLLRALNMAAEKKGVDGWEGEVSQEIALRSQAKPQGFYLPVNLPMRANAPTGEKRAFDTTAGTGLIPTILATGRLIDALRAMPIISQLGAQVISDCVGQLDIPRMTSMPSYGWNGESAVGSESVPGTDNVPFTAKTLNIWYRITRRMRHQTSIDVENKLRMMAMTQMALGIDATAIAGSGSSNTPTGLLNNSSITTVALGTNGASPTYASVVTMETNINDSNAQSNNMAYLTSQRGRGTLKQVSRIGSTYPSFIWGDDNTVNGYKAVSSTLVPKNLTKGSGTGLSAMLFGNWNALIIALWGNIDVIVDPFTQTAGDLKITMMQDADINVEHPESFSKIVDMITL